MEQIDVYQELESSLPLVISRAEVHRLLGGIISVGRLANLDCLGQGPGGRITLGRKVGYLRSPFVAWMRKRSRQADAGQEG